MYMNKKQERKKQTKARLSDVEKQIDNIIEVMSGVIIVNVNATMAVLDNYIQMNGDVDKLQKYIENHIKQTMKEKKNEQKSNEASGQKEQTKGSRVTKDGSKVS